MKRTELAVLLLFAAFAMLAMAAKATGMTLEFTKSCDRATDSEDSQARWIQRTLTAGDSIIPLGRTQAVGCRLHTRGTASRSR